MADTFEPRPVRTRTPFNGSLIAGLLAGFAVGATAGGLLVAALIEDTNEPTKPFYASPEPEPVELEPERPGDAPTEGSIPAGGVSGDPAGT